jgi:hypothetical protein
MKNLAQESLAFAEKTGSSWQETGGGDCNAYQRSFLCRQAFGSYHTAKSYWILHENGCFSDCVGLSRNLLERIANSVCGAKSPLHAVELITYELSEKIRHAKLWTPSPHLSVDLQRAVQEHEAILPTFLTLINATKAPDWGFIKRFQEGGVRGYYRSAYFDFSRYAHAGYEVPRPGKFNEQSKAADFIALTAPVITGAIYHALDCNDCSQAKCVLHAESLGLLKKFSSLTLGGEAKE